MRNNSEPLTITIRQTEQTLNLGHTSVYRLIKSGALETVKVGGKTLVKYPSVKRVAESGAA